MAKSVNKLARFVVIAAIVLAITWLIGYFIGYLDDDMRRTIGFTWIFSVTWWGIHFITKWLDSLVLRYQ